MLQLTSGAPGIGMSEEKRQRYVAYRVSTDEFEVRFFGGPLDGARIVTDVFPDSETFPHRFGERTYVYRYKQVAKYGFHASLDPDGLNAETPTEPKTVRFGLLLGSVALTMLTLAGLVVFLLSRIS